MKRDERGETIKHTRWKRGEIISTKVDGLKRNEGRLKMR